jgi:hypothetical protein
VVSLSLKNFTELTEQHAEKATGWQVTGSINLRDIVDYCGRWNLTE